MWTSDYNNHSPPEAQTFPKVFECVLLTREMQVGNFALVFTELSQILEQHLDLLCE